MKCPICNTTLMPTEDVEIDRVDAVTLDAIVAGKCPECGKSYIWTERYMLVSAEGLEEDE